MVLKFSSSLDDSVVSRISKCLRWGRVDSSGMELCKKMEIFVFLPCRIEDFNH